jgi:hypothetical protein
MCKKEIIIEIIIQKKGDFLEIRTRKGGAIPKEDIKLIPISLIRTVDCDSLNGSLYIHKKKERTICELSGYPCTTILKAYEEISEILAKSSPYG